MIVVSLASDCVIDGVMRAEGEVIAVASNFPKRLVRRVVETAAELAERARRQRREVSARKIMDAREAAVDVADRERPASVTYDPPTPVADHAAVHRKAEGNGVL